MHCIEDTLLLTAMNERVLPYGGTDSPQGGCGRVNGYVLHNENLPYEICMEESAQQADSCCSIVSLETRHTLHS